jgi:hypothetical protein
VTDTGKDVAGSAASTAKDAAKDNINQETRRGVNEVFKGIFKK